MKEEMDYWQQKVYDRLPEDTKAFQELLDEFNERFKAFQHQYPNSEHSEITVWVGIGDKPPDFKPGVPTEDGWYTITTLNDEGKPFYETIYFFGGTVATKRWDNNPIISFLKLPDL